MNTHDIDIELPPLPKFDRLSSMHADDVVRLLRSYGRKCARAAIKAALQSQDAEDAVPYEVVVNVANKLLGAEQYERFMGELDHARRAEGADDA